MGGMSPDAYLLGEILLPGGSLAHQGGGELPVAEGKILLSGGGLK